MFSPLYRRESVRVPSRDWRFSRGLGYIAFGTMCLVYFFSYFQRTVIPGTIFEELQADLHLRASTIATLGSMFTWIYGGMQILVGLLATRYGGGRMLLLGGIAMGLGALLFPLVHTIPALFAARALAGFGASFMYLCTIKEMDRLLGAKHFTVWLGLFLFVGYSGGVAATLPFERATAAFGWRVSLSCVAGATLASVAGAWGILRLLGTERGRSLPFSWRPLVAVVRNPSCRPLLGHGLLHYSIYFAILSTLGKKFLQDMAGLSSPASASFVLIMSVVSMISAMCGGLLPRLTGGRRKPIMRFGALLHLVATVVLLAAVALRTPGWVYLLGFILLAASNSSFVSGTTSMKELNRPEHATVSIAMMNGLAYVGSGTLGQVGGAILEYYHPGTRDLGQVAIYPPAAYLTLFGLFVILSGLNYCFVRRVPESAASRRVSRHL